MRTEENYTEERRGYNLGTEHNQVAIKKRSLYNSCKLGTKNRLRKTN